ncbi:Prokaryotic membrane lipoprotein lipid attachment site [Carpediemonas membranifera]|uniref:Prokaryotic membrane lipoprotein lipid attachment site n=1 Tax=Carpediemonas membranifera TaxID=201153 RepID=A0A8J6B9V0_9EUKA|nr:Prokaryotic membrane lipoprotein lipid attachment site [Carpediemonas membranifera]|eukprot:KAG9395762.1 Prokaryotic membrane lipoprotein lipid attachment site [Carpediemonas membranifera]
MWYKRMNDVQRMERLAELYDEHRITSHGFSSWCACIVKVERYRSKLSSAYRFNKRSILQTAFTQYKLIVSRRLFARAHGDYLITRNAFVGWVREARVSIIATDHCRTLLMKKALLHLRVATKEAVVDRKADEFRSHRLAGLVFRHWIADCRRNGRVRREFRHRVSEWDRKQTLDSVWSVLIRYHDSARVKTNLMEAAHAAFQKSTKEAVCSLADSAAVRLLSQDVVHLTAELTRLETAATRLRRHSAHPTTLAGPKKTMADVSTTLQLLSAVSAGPVRDRVALALGERLGRLGRWGLE